MRMLNRFLTLLAIVAFGIGNPSESFGHDGHAKASDHITTSIGHEISGAGFKVYLGEGKGAAEGMELDPSVSENVTRLTCQSLS